MTTIASATLGLVSGSLIRGWNVAIVERLEAKTAGAKIDLGVAFDLLGNGQCGFAGETFERANAPHSCPPVIFC
jgi:hypothetical protein